LFIWCKGKANAGKKILFINGNQIKPEIQR
jgi:hypothetical protein